MVYKSEPDDCSMTCEWASEQSESEQSEPENVDITRPKVQSQEYVD